MIPFCSFQGGANSCVTRVRFSPLKGDPLALAVDSAGFIRLMDLAAQRSANFKFFENLFLENDVSLPHLCDFAFSRCGKCVYVSSSDGLVSVGALNALGTHLNKDNSLLTIHDTHAGGTFCVYPSPEYDFMLYTGGGDGFLRVWDLRLMSSRNIYNSQENGLGKAWTKPLMSLWAHVRPLSSMSLSISNRIITSGFNENVRIWDGQTFLPIDTIDGTALEMAVWDLVVDESRPRVATVGECGGVSTFQYETDEDNFTVSNIKKIRTSEVETGCSAGFETEEQLLFKNWKRICQYGNSLVIPRLNSDDPTKAVLIDMDTGNLVDKLAFEPDSGRNGWNIASVDVHPDPDVGLVLSGGSIMNGRCTLWVKESGL